MSRLLLPRLQVALASTLALACDRQAPTQPTDATAQRPAPSQGSASKLPEFDPDDFVRVVDNPFFPLRPGTRFIYTGTDDGEPQRIVVDVTHQRKRILGIKVTVVLDRVYVNGSLKEKTLDWYAQDEDGNVWYLGEDSKEYEDGEVVSTAGSWEAGKNGAKAGLIMLAHPRVGRTYPQERAPGVAEDMARVLRRGEKISTPYRKLRNCLRTEEFTPLEPDVLELKFYCAGIGLVKGRAVTGGTGRFALTQIRR